MPGATASPASAPTQSKVVLPSIHEMFPEYLFPHHLHRGNVPSTAFRSGAGCPIPSSAHAHLAANRQRRPASDRDVPASRYSPDGDTYPEVEFEGDNDNDFNEEQPEEDGVEGSAGARKHVCHTCGKRFNRPSSLKIHVNTHTGAMPFRCPYPNCNRAFNVNSNMRRHYRNHATTIHGGPTTYSYNYPSSTALVATVSCVATFPFPSRRRPSPCPLYPRGVSGAPAHVRLQVRPTHPSLIITSRPDRRRGIRRVM
ncbi:hypothetical protein FB45DRAFT_214623 [Roridomyces roridus]|uniref:C2H2-type domain-containing protein n=1 Tax=Roridomyces roridus TaxID=1738132 RepID=A0AAD7BDR7_9AGAR|nr:hypothetical protein FB45DRAFT_214623 [Roridomyces roridus]